MRDEFDEEARKNRLKKSGTERSRTHAGIKSRMAARAEKRKKTRRIVIMAIAEVFTLAFIFSYAYVARLMVAVQRPQYKGFSSAPLAI